MGEGKSRRLFCNFRMQLPINPIERSGIDRVMAHLGVLYGREQVTLFERNFHHVAAETYYNVYQ